MSETTATEAAARQSEILSVFNTLGLATSGARAQYGTELSPVAVPTGVRVIISTTSDPFTS